MAQKYNIYINQKALIITSIRPNDGFDCQILDVQGFEFEKFYKSLSKNPQAIFYLLTDEPKAVFKMVKNSLRIIEAAGGLVKSNEHKYLFIKRNGRWDLPKGKLEEGERKRDAAVREVEEECGIVVKKLGKKLTKTYHVYEIKGKPVLKISHWYDMSSKSNQKLIPQIEEGITDVKWIAKKDWNLVKANTYPSILDVLAIA
ncbi:diadenosine hexaphosphate hydrolase [Pedobacter glucosidilyticus]|nr:NUDIX domain-containing protein [Pedobacter glucosidilyticus]KHJ39173.1 diadenosine hexaphosphate hydrolase [Pedobacter glucosidilyticus]